MEVKSTKQNQAISPRCWGKSKLLKKLLLQGRMGNLVAVPQKRAGRGRGTIPFTNHEREFNFWARADFSTTGCWNWTGRLSEHGYGTAHWITGTKQAHRIAWMLVKENPGDMKICHKCDNRKCIRPDHLFKGTQMDNVQDMWNKGRARILRGESNRHSILKNGDVFEIRKLASNGHVNRQLLMKKYGVSHSAICFVINGRSWKHLLPAEDLNYE